jgi:hypothetical protein
MPTVKELKTLLHAKGMPVSGNKPELLARLKKKTVVATTSASKKSVTGRMNVPKSKRLSTSSKSTKSATNSRATVPRFQRGTGYELYKNDYTKGYLIKTSYNWKSNLTETQLEGFGYRPTITKNGKQVSLPTLDGEPVNIDGVYKSDKGNIAFLSYDSDSRSSQLQWYSAVLKPTAPYRGRSVGEGCKYDNDCGNGNTCWNGECTSGNSALGYSLQN